MKSVIMSSNRFGSFLTMGQIWVRFGSDFGHFWVIFGSFLTVSFWQVVIFDH